MSSHPGNPYWSHSTDRAIVIYRQDWDEAMSGGHVTPEHIAQRIAGMIQHAYGVHEGDVVAYDADGFIITLIAEGLSMSNGVKLVVHTGDHNPPHAHVEVPGHRGRLTINLETFELQEELPNGWSRRGRKIEREARERAGELIALWNKNRGPGARGLSAP